MSLNAYVSNFKFAKQGAQKGSTIEKGDAPAPLKKATPPPAPAAPVKAKDADSFEEKKVSSPRDPASGQATGKRQHAPIRF